MGNAKKPNTIRTKLLIVFGIGVFSLTACLSHKNGPSDTHKPELFITYLFTAETIFEKIEINQNRLSYTYFEDSNNKCSRWFYQYPCWTEKDLKKKEAILANSDINDLISLILQTKFMELANIYSNAPPEQRSYPYIVKVKLQEMTREVIYQSFKNDQSMPEAMEKLIEMLYKLVKREFK